MPGYQLAVEIDNSRLATFGSIAANTRDTIELTPIEQAQTRAIVKVFAVSAGRRIHLTSFDLSPIPQPPDRKAVIRLSARIDNDKWLRLRLDVENRLYARRELRIRRYLGGPSPLGVGAALLLLLLLGAGVAYLSLQQRPTGNEAPEPEAAANGNGVNGAETGGGNTSAPDDEGVADSAAATETGSASSSESSSEGAADDVTMAEDDVAPQEDEIDDTDADLAEQSWTVYFQPDSAELTEATGGTLDNVAEALSDADSVQLELVGHTALFGTEQGRVELSRERAERVAEFLSARVDADAVSIRSSGAGGSSPVTEARDEQHLNRRVEIDVTDRAEGGS